MHLYVYLYVSSVKTSKYHLTVNNIILLLTLYCQQQFYWECFFEFLQGTFSIGLLFTMKPVHILIEARISHLTKNIDQKNHGKCPFGSSQ